MAADILRTRYLSRSETAEALGIATRTLDRWWSLRVGPPRTKVGNQVYYRREAVEAWLLAQEDEPVREADAGRRAARMDPAARRRAQAAA